MPKPFTKVGVATLAMLALLITGFMTAAPAQADSPTCNTLSLGTGFTLGVTVRPSMDVPVCYDGSRIWVNGGISPGVSTIGYNTGGFDWVGSYNDSSQSWLGVGENYSVTVWTGAASFYCKSRWLLDAHGHVYSFTRGC